MCAQAFAREIKAQSVIHPDFGAAYPFRSETERNDSMSQERIAVEDSSGIRYEVVSSRGDRADLNAAGGKSSRRGPPTYTLMLRGMYHSDVAPNAEGQFIDGTGKVYTPLN